MDPVLLRAVAQLMVSEADAVLAALEQARNPVAAIFSGNDETRIHTVIWKLRRAFWLTVLNSPPAKENTHE